MKPKTQNMDVKAPRAASGMNHPVVHDRVRFGRFFVGGVALVGMVSVAMLGANADLMRTPMVGLPAVVANSTPDDGISAPLGPGGAPAPAKPSRIAGSGASGVAVSVAKRAFPGKAAEVYVARLDNPVDALAASILPKGPILLVPATGNVPTDIINEIKALNPSRIVVLGGTGAISDEVKNYLSTYTGKPTTRIAGANRVATAAAIAKYAYPSGNPTVYLADAVGANGKGSPDSVAGGVLRDGPIVTVSRAAGDIATAAQTVKALGANKVVALGGSAVVPDSVLNQVAGGASTARIAGANRYLTSVMIGKHVFGNKASQVYLAPGNDLSYALVAGSLTDGPIILTPATSDTNTRGLVTAFGNPKVTAIGSAVPENVMQVAAGYANPQQRTTVQATGSTQNSVPVAAASKVYTKLSMQPSPTDQAREDAVYAQINKVRAHYKLRALERNPVMDDAARAWAQQVARTDVFKHSDTDSRLEYSHLMPAGWKMAGENMVGYFNIEPGPYAEGATKVWCGSKGHFENLTRSNYTHTGVGVATGRQWVYAVQNFAQY